MDEMPVENMVSEIRKYITEYLPLSQMSDEELEEKIEEIVAEKPTVHITQLKRSWISYIRYTVPLED